MKGYWLILGSPVTDAQAQETYGQLWKPIAAQYNAKISVLNTDVSLLETGGYTRVLIVAFDSYAQALACYRDEAYQAAKVFARKAATREFLILEGEPPKA